MQRVRVAVVNASGLLDDAEVAAGVRALSAQLEQHFAPAWGIEAELRVVGADEIKTKLPGYWALTLLASEQAVGGATGGVEGGYHDMTSEGLPLAKVYVADARTAGVEWTQAASHELLEMLADPRLEVSHAHQERSLVFYVQEVCDPCEGDGYLVEGRRVSNFVYPAWFGGISGDSPAFDQMDTVAGAFELSPKGSIVYFDTAAREWKLSRRSGAGQVEDERAPAGRVGLRGKPRSAWRASDYIWSP